MPAQADASAAITGHLRRRLHTRYRIERELGQGGMAIVYLAHDLKHDRQVAMKVLRPDVSALLGAERFLREIHIAAQLHHPGIVGLYDSGEAGGLLYYVMPYEEGQTLRARLAGGALPLGDALRLGEEIADALAYAHEHGVVHRDIKPENILLLPHGHAAIADFGIARALADAPAVRTSSTVQLGTPAYMSPEQVTGGEIGPRTDVYALGCVVFEMLAGAPPFGMDDAQTLLNAHCSAPVPSLRERRREVPLAVDQAIRRAMAKRPEERFARADEFATALRVRRLSAGGVARAARTWARRHVPALAGLAAVAIAVAWGLRSLTPGGTGERLRIAIPAFTATAPDLRPRAARLAQSLTEDLSRLVDLAVVPSSDLRRYPDATPARLRAAFGTDQTIVGTLGRDSVFVRVVDSRSGRALRLMAAATAGVGDALVVRRLDNFVRQAMAAHRDSLEWRSRFRREDAWALVQQARAQMGTAEDAVLAGAYRAAAQAFGRADSLARAAAALESGGAAGRMAVAGILDRWAFVLEFLQQARPDTTDYLPDLAALRRSALASLDSVLARDPDDAAALQLRGNIKEGLLRLTGHDSLLGSAIHDLERATALDGGRALAWAQLASCYGHIGAFQEELFAYERALRADPFQYHRAVYLRGTFDAALAAGQPERGAAACRDGEREFPDDPRFADCRLKLLSRTAATPAEAARAVALADSLARNETNATFLAVWRLFAAQALARAGRSREAERNAARALAGLPAHAPSAILLELAALRLLVNDRDSALTLARRVIAESPSTRAYLLHDPRFRALRAALAQGTTAPPP